MTVILIKAAQLLLSLVLLVLLHELGHFATAKLCGTRVSKFYIFFDWKFALWRKKIGETEYGIGWLPLGGYCTIDGMVDETQHSPHDPATPPEPWEFRSKPVGQRLLIMAAGVLVNALAAVVIYTLVFYHWGDTYVATTDMTYGMAFSPQAKALGFRDGDRLLATNRRPFKTFDADLYRDLATATECYVLRASTSGSTTADRASTSGNAADRQGSVNFGNDRASTSGSAADRQGSVNFGNEVDTLTIALPGNLDLLAMLRTEPRFVSPLIPAIVDSVLPHRASTSGSAKLDKDGSAAAASSAGLRPGDRLLGIGSASTSGSAETDKDTPEIDKVVPTKLATQLTPLTSWNALADTLAQRRQVLATAATHADSLRQQRLTLVVQHADTPDHSPDTLTLTLGPDLLLGITIASPLATYPTTHVAYSLLSAARAAATHAANVLRGYASDLRYLATADGMKSLGGFATIGSLFPSTWQWQAFWTMTAFLSIILAFMNILPIPALDGGHIFFLLVELCTRRRPSEQLLIAAEYVGLAIVILLVLLANLNDLLRLLHIF